MTKFLIDYFYTQMNSFLLPSFVCFQDMEEILILHKNKFLKIEFKLLQVSWNLLKQYKVNIWPLRRIVFTDFWKHLNIFCNLKIYISFVKRIESTYRATKSYYFFQCVFWHLIFVDFHYRFDIWERNSLRNVIFSKLF